jgi:hypothetical protein
MAILGVRCSNSDFTYVILDGSFENPKIELLENIQIPHGYKQSESLDWLYKEVCGILGRNEIEIIVIKKFEGRNRGGAFAQRVAFEAMVMLAAEHSAKIPVFKKVKRTIAKDMGFKGRAKYLRTDLDTAAIKGFEDRNNKEKDAILAAWSELK